MTTDIAIISQKYHEYNQDDMDHLLEANTKLESEIKRLRKDKEQLHEQLCLIKTLSDGLWDRLKANHWL